MPENKPIEPSARYILDSLANYISKPPTAGERGDAPVMSQGPKQFNTYEQWLQETPPEKRRYSRDGQTWEGLPPEESSRLWKDRQLDFAGQAFRSAVKVPTNLLGLATATADKMYEVGTANSDLVTYPMLRYLYRDNDPGLRQRLYEESAARAQEVRNKGGILTKPIRWWHNKIDQYTPEVIEDPWPNEAYTRAVQKLSGNDKQYSNADINRHMGNLAGFLSGSVMTGEAMPQAVNRLFSIKDSPLLHYTGRPFGYFNRYLSHRAASAAAPAAVKTFDKVNKHLIKAVNRAGHGLQKADSVVRISNPKAAYGLGVVPWANNAYGAAPDSPLGITNKGVSLATGGLEGVSQSFAQDELQSMPVSYKPTEYSFADNQQ